MGDAHFHVYLLNEADGHTLTLSKGKQAFKQDSYAWGRSKALKHEEAQGRLQPDGSLLIVCDVEFFPSVNPLDSDQLGEHFSVPAPCEATLKEGCICALGDLLATGANSDCTLVVGSGMGT